VDVDVDVERAPPPAAFDLDSRSGPPRSQPTNLRRIPAARVIPSPASFAGRRIYGIARSGEWNSRKGRAYPGAARAQRRRAPAFHSWIEIELEEMFEGYYVNRSLAVRANRLDARIVS
jgi:hypothetical protein